MKLTLVKASNTYRSQIVDMLEEWNAYGEKIIPYATVVWTTTTLICIVKILR